MHLSTSRQHVWCFLFLVNIVNTSVRRFCGYNKVLIKHLYRYDFHMVLFVFRVENNSINSLTFQICSNIFTRIVRIQAHYIKANGDSNSVRTTVVKKACYCISVCSNSYYASITTEVQISLYRLVTRKNRWLPGNCIEFFCCHTPMASDWVTTNDCKAIGQVA